MTDVNKQNTTYSTAPYMALKDTGLTENDQPVYAPLVALAADSGGSDLHQVAKDLTSTTDILAQYDSFGSIADRGKYLLFRQPLSN